MNFPPGGSNPRVFSELLEAWDFDDCCLRAEDTLDAIWQNIGPAYTGELYAGDPYHGGSAVDYKRDNRARVLEFRDAIEHKMDMVDGASEEAQILRFIHSYVELIKDFVRQRYADEREDDPHACSEKLAPYVGYFEDLLADPISRISLGYRLELAGRARLAAAWCQSHLERLRTPPTKRRTFWERLFGGTARGGRT